MGSPTLVAKDATRVGQPLIFSRVYVWLIAAGVVLRGNQNQAWTADYHRLGPWSASESEQDSSNGEIGSEDTESNGGDYGGAENEGHQECDHVSSTFVKSKFLIECSNYSRPFKIGLSLSALDLPNMILPR